MNSQYHIKSLKGVSIEHITDCFNRAFSDYSVPIQSTPQQLHERLVGNGYAAEWSTGVFEGDKLQAFVLHGSRGIDGPFKLYNAGTGTARAARGQSLTLQQYEYLLPKAREAGCSGIELEVITDNAAAIHTYKKAGFQISNTLSSFKGHLAVSSKRPYEVIEVDSLDWPGVQQFWDWEPSWQHSRDAMEINWKLHKSVQVLNGAEVLGYAIFNPESGRVAQFGLFGKDRM